MESRLSQTRYEEREKIGGKQLWTNRSPMVQLMDETISPVVKLKDTLSDVIDGVRENALCDVFIAGPSDGRDPAWDQVETDNDAVRTKVISSDAAIAEMIETMNAEDRRYDLVLSAS